MKNLKKFKKNKFDDLEKERLTKKAKTKPKKLLRNEPIIKWSKKNLEEELYEDEQ